MSTNTNTAIVYVSIIVMKPLVSLLIDSISQYYSRWLVSFKENKQFILLSIEALYSRYGKG